MIDYPRDLVADEISPGLAALIRDLAGRLLDGPTVEHRALRGQLGEARIDRVTLTGAGLYAYFAHPRGTPSVSPPEMIDGEVEMHLPELDAPAGSLLKVSDGRLDFVEIYTVTADRSTWRSAWRWRATAGSTPGPSGTLPARATMTSMALKRLWHHVARFGAVVIG